jgi:hypothetical protein
MNFPGYKGPASQFTHAGFTAGTIWTYWVAAISRAGNEGPFSAPVTVNTPLGYDPSGILASSIADSQLVQDLQQKIGLITAPASTPGSVAQIAQAAGDMALDAIADLQQALGTASTGLLWLSGQLSTLSSAFRSAGFVIDPTTGALVYSAINQIATSTGSLITSVQEQLDATNASIELKADAATVNTQLAALIAGNQPILSDLFQGATDGWAASGATLIAKPASITVTSTGTAPLLAKSGLSIAGNTYDQVVMVVRRLDSGVDWLGQLEWSTAGHGFAGANQAAVPAPTGFGAFQTLTWDLSANADWGASTVTGLQFALSNAAGDSFEIQSIQVTKNVVQQLLVSGLQGQITSAQLAISGLQASIAQAASATTVNNQGVQIATLTSEVNALTGEIVLKADQTDLTDLQTALTAAELTLDSLQGQITENIEAVTVPGAESAGEAALAALVDQAKQGVAVNGALAQARQQLQAYTDNVASAQAALTTALTSVVNANAAAITVEAQTRAAADAAAASLIIQLQAQVGSNSASITQQIQAVANSASTLAAEFSSLTANFNGNLAGLQSSVSATATQSGANAQAIGVLQTSVGGNSAAIQTIESSLNGISAEYTIQTEVDVHGTRYIAGIGALANASGVSQVTILANDFLVAGMNADGSLNPVSPFEVVNGQVLMQKAVVGTITADQIAANTTYTGNLSIGNGQLLLHGGDDGNGNGPYFIARDNNGTNRALVGRFGNEWGIWVWNASGANVLSADGLGVAVAGTSNLQQFAASGMSGASTAGAQSIPTTQTWVDVQTVAFTVVSGATGVAITYSAELLDLYADPNAPYGGGGNNDAGGGNGGGGGDN